MKNLLNFGRSKLTFPPETKPAETLVFGAIQEDTHGTQAPRSWNISRLVGTLRSRRGEVSAHSPALGGGRVAGNSRKVPGDIHGDFSCRFMSRVSHLPERWIAVIVRRRIVKQRLDDKLAALDDSRHRHRHRFPYRRSRAWRDANAMIANLSFGDIYESSSSRVASAISCGRPAARLLRMRSAREIYFVAASP